MDVSDAPVGGLAGLWVNDEKVTLGPPDPAGSLYPGHQPVTEGQYAGHVWIKLFDGTQTTAAMGDLGGAGGNSAGRPWSEDMIGRGVAYAIVRFRYNDEVFRSMPTVLYEVNGIGFYDPRKDSTVGGSGAHRWGNRATYEPSENPAVPHFPFRAPRANSGVLSRSPTRSGSRRSSRSASRASTATCDGTGVPVGSCIWSCAGATGAASATTGWNAVAVCRASA